MTLFFLGVSVGLLWINLVGAGLLVWRFVKDYAISRIVGVLGICLAAFFFEHFAGFGPNPPLLPFTTVLSGWLIWRHRDLIRSHMGMEAVFAIGFLYCLLWRFSYPDIDATSERMPNLAFIDGYMKGQTLPAPDRWLWLYRANFYYSFQHYGAGLLGRLLGVSPGMAYHLGYCTIASLIAGALGATAARLCPWRWGRGMLVLTLLMGGSGAMAAVHLFLKGNFFFDAGVRFLGGFALFSDHTALGAWFAKAIIVPGLDTRDLPMEPLSYVLAMGDFHPPLAGHLLLALACLLIAALEMDDGTRPRPVLHSLLAATVPSVLISNAWVFPLQLVLVVGWFVYCRVRREQGWFWPAAIGAAVAALLIYPHLREFSQGASANYAALRFVESEDHTPWIGWLLIFWPVVGVIILSLFNRERRGFILFLASVWILLLLFTEIVYNDDLYGGPWSRFNTTMKWWPWVYAGVVLTLGSLNLGSRSRACRYGTLALLLPTCVYVADLLNHLVFSPKPVAGNLSGAGWIQSDPAIRDLITALSIRPDGVTLESGLEMTNTVSPANTLFSRKQSLIGWPWHETTWRGPFAEIRERLEEIGDFYAGKYENPLPWLLKYNVRYIVWVAQDNADGNVRFHTLRERIKSHYIWNRTGGNDEDLSVGFFERRRPGGGHHADRR